MEKKLTAFATVVRDRGVNYHAAYQAWQNRAFELTRLEVGAKTVLLLDAEQAQAFDAWAEQQRAAA